MKVAVVGSREGCDLSQVAKWCAKLWDKQGPTTTLVSGGAAGVDNCAEQAWLGLGGHVKSFRPLKTSRPDQEDEFYIQVWELGGEKPQVYMEVGGPGWADYASACAYRDMLIAESADKLVAFWNGRSRGTAFTVEHAEGLGKEVYVYAGS